jgi:hypothetical protein
LGLALQDTSAAIPDEQWQGALATNRAIAEIQYLAFHIQPTGAIFYENSSRNPPPRIGWTCL